MSVENDDDDISAYFDGFDRKLWARLYPWWMDLWQNTYVGVLIRGIRFVPLMLNVSVLFCVLDAVITLPEYYQRESLWFHAWQYYLFLLSLGSSFLLLLLPVKLRLRLFTIVVFAVEWYLVGWAGVLSKG